jgi:hypothetical protein
LPVLAVSLMLGFGAVSLIPTAAYHCVVPFFGFVLSGAPGALFILLIAAVLTWLVVGVYRLRMAAWWGTVVVLTIGSFSTVLTFSRQGLMDFYRAGGFSDEQLRMIEQMAAPMGALMTWGMVLFGVAMVGYLLFVKKYFVAAAATARPPA